jgi:hypothetical protein
MLDSSPGTYKANKHNQNKRMEKGELPVAGKENTGIIPKAVSS